MAIDNILVVDDEDGVRQTVVSWLRDADLGCDVLAAADAEEALVVASEHSIDLAVLDWNLGAGNDGLRLLEDLTVFHPDLVAILMTAYAQQATPLAALRRGVRDYLDKGIDFKRDMLVASVKRQLDKIRPAKRQREFYQSLAIFRETVEKVLPLVRSTTTLNDPVPLPEAVRSLFRFMMQATGATGGVLLVRAATVDGQDNTQAFDVQGGILPTPSIPFANSLAATVMSMQEPCVLSPTGDDADSIAWQPFERNRFNILASPINIGSGVMAVLELFDKPGDEGFNDADRRLIGSVSTFASELLRQALSERQTQRLLFDAVDAALKTSTRLASEWTPGKTPTADSLQTPPPQDVLAKLREGLDDSPQRVIGGEASVRLAEAIRVLALRHGPEAVQHCTQLVESLRIMLDRVTGVES